jgi:hypothetical protein
LAGKKTASRLNIEAGTPIGKRIFFSHSSFWKLQFAPQICLSCHGNMPPFTPPVLRDLRPQPAAPEPPRAAVSAEAYTAKLEEGTPSTTASSTAASADLDLQYLDDDHLVTPLRDSSSPPTFTDHAKRPDATTSTAYGAAGPACRFKSCKKVTKFAESDAVLKSCLNSGCVFYVHHACAKQLLALFNADASFEGAICGKRCYNAYLKAMREAETDPNVKKRIPWHNDGYTPSISSLSCLIDWMTTGSNYRRYRGGKEQTGETKLVIAGEVVRLIEESGITTVRTAKDVQTKISALEESYRKASDWLKATGQGVEDEHSLKAAILSRCPYY